MSIEVIAKKVIKITAILYLFIIILMRVIQSIFSKKANLLLPDGVRSYTEYITLSKALAAFFALISLLLTADGFKGFNITTFVIAGISGAFLTINSVCGIKALKSGTMVLSSIFGTAGMLVPSILGVIFFDESISFLQVVFVIVLIASMCSLALASKKIYGKFDLKTALYLVGNMLSNGMVMFCQKSFGELQPDGNVSLFSMLTFLIPTVALLCFLPFVSKNKASESSADKKLPKTIYICAVFLAFAVFVIQQLVTVLTTEISTIVLFAFVNGGATIISALVGAAVYKEKLTLKSGISVIIGVIALIGLKIFE